MQASRKGRTKPILVFSSHYRNDNQGRQMSVCGLCELGRGSLYVCGHSFFNSFEDLTTLDWVCHR